MLTQIPNFRVGIVLLDNGNEQGEARYSNWASQAAGYSDWATDPDRYDPDAIAIHLQTLPQQQIGTLDFRVFCQASDRGGGLDLGPDVCTPWASEGGGASRIAFDEDCYDPDAFRIGLQTRPWPNRDLALRDFRVGIQVYDRGNNDGFGLPVFTPWMSLGGGWSIWAQDKDGYDPDGVIIHLNVNTQPVYHAS